MKGSLGVRFGKVASLTSMKWKHRDEQEDGVKGVSEPQTRRKCTLYKVPLAMLLEKYEGFQVPPFVEKACLFIVNTATEVEGIFRLSGNNLEVEQYKKILDEGDDIPFWEPSPHTVCNLLKMYIRELPDPILTYQLYDAFIEAAKSAKQKGTEDEKSFVEELNQLIMTLPFANKCLLKRVIWVLDTVNRQQEVNKMNATNLATVFGPNFLRTEDPDGLARETILTDAGLVNTIATVLIQNYDSILQDVELESPYIGLVSVDYDYEPQSEGEIPLKKGDIIWLMDRDESGWWKGESKMNIGFFPSTYVTDCDWETWKQQNKASEGSSNTSYLANSVGAPEPESSAQQATQQPTSTSSPGGSGISGMVNGSGSPGQRTQLGGNAPKHPAPAGKPLPSTPPVKHPASVQPNNTRPALVNNHPVGPANQLARSLPAGRGTGGKPLPASPINHSTGTAPVIKADSPHSTPQTLERNTPSERPAESDNAKTVNLPRSGSTPPPLDLPSSNRTLTHTLSSVSLNVIRPSGVMKSPAPGLPSPVSAIPPPLDGSSGQQSSKTSLPSSQVQLRPRTDVKEWNAKDYQGSDLEEVEEYIDSELKDLYQEIKEIEKEVRTTLGEDETRKPVTKQHNRYDRERSKGSSGPTSDRTAPKKTSISRSERFTSRVSKQCAKAEIHG
eukprot:TRINITY_DN724_c0_g1_i1.p1 TRINITY_DN724_c0_g1~~TRINITY_DN724_c0_g1_i1.p1  ORF type:complete len:671 (-),score=151.06 TRINITY_DN724_c0_g1_i1:3693-5705(-)